MVKRDPISKKVRALSPSGIRKYFDLVAGMDGIISLGVGEPDFVTPWNIREAAIYALREGFTSYTSNLGMPALTEMANRLVAKPGRLLILVNTVGDRVNVVVASSGTIDAGGVCKKLCALLGGGGGGKPNLAMGGGNSKGVEKILEEFIP